MARELLCRPCIEFPWRAATNRLCVTPGVRDQLEAVALEWNLARQTLKAHALLIVTASRPMARPLGLGLLGNMETIPHDVAPQGV
jgi:hypothetical protein